MNEHIFSIKRSLVLYSLLLGVSTIASTPTAAYAQTALSWARIEFLRNRVQLLPQGRSGRAARLADIMGVGDALRTAASSRAELRFNDGSLARIGERAVFRFTPNTRNFQLSNGTMLLLIPPGQGRTTIQTPHAVTGIQGSALFVRTIPETETTIVGALTNNVQGPMVVYCEDGSTAMPLYAGQMAVIENCQTSVYDFDLRTFYETSGLVEGLQLDNPEARLETDALNGVRQEILDALDEQGNFDQDGTLSNPSFLTPPEISSASTNDESTPVAFPSFENSTVQWFHNATATASVQGEGSQHLAVSNSGSTTSQYPQLEELDTSRIANQLTNQPDGNPPVNGSLPTNGASPSTVATGSSPTSGPPSGVSSPSNPAPTAGSNAPGTTNPSTPTGGDTVVVSPPVTQPPSNQTPTPNPGAQNPTTPSTPVVTPPVTTPPVVTTPPGTTPSGSDTPGTTPGVPNPNSGGTVGRPDVTVPPDSPDWTGTPVNNGVPATTPEEAVNASVSTNPTVP